MNSVATEMLAPESDEAAQKRNVAHGTNTPNAVPATPPHRVAVVGGGASGLATVIAIIEQYSQQNPATRPPLNIQWYNKGDNFGPGSAYNERDAIYDLNVPARQMSVVASNPRHCVEWLNKSYPGEYNQNSFLPRSIYAEYLKTTAETTVIDATRQGISITPSYSEVTSVAKNGNGFKVYTSPQNYIKFNQTVIAVGHMPADDPFRGVLDNSGKYFRTVDAASHDAVLKAIPKGPESEGKEVFINGFASTAVDRIRLLYQSGFKGGITIVTRHGVQPWAYNPKLDEKSGYMLSSNFAVEKMEEIARGYAAKRTSASRAQAVEPFVKLVEQEMITARDQGFGPQHFLFSPALVESVDNEKVRAISPAFVEAAKRIVTLYKSNPTPPTDANIIQRYMDSGRLKVIIGNAETALYVPDTGKIAVKSRVEGQEQKGEYDLVFNGAPYARDYRNHSLFRELVSNGLGRFDRETGAMECGKRGEMAAHGLFVVGAAATKPGETWGIETFRDRAQKIAEAIVYNMASVTARYGLSPANDVGGTRPEPM